MAIYIWSNGSYIDECPTNMIKADVRKTRQDHKPGLLVFCLLLAVKWNSETRQWVSILYTCNQYTFTCNLEQQTSNLLDITNTLRQKLTSSSIQMLQLCTFRLAQLVIFSLTKEEFVYIYIFKLTSSVMFVLKRAKLILNSYNLN